jgi:hypothetical protein
MEAVTYRLTCILQMRHQAMRLFLYLALIVAIGFPLAGQQITQRMARDVAAAKVVVAETPAPLLDADAIRRIGAVDQLDGDVTRVERGALRRVSERLRRKNRAAALQDWERLIGAIKQRGAEPNVSQLSAWVVNRVYLARSPELKPLADTIRFREQQREAAYGSRERLEKITAKLEERGPADGMTIRPVALAENRTPGVPAVVTSEPIPATVDSVADELAKIVVLCSKADENVELANLDLNNALQKQQQTLQTMSNVSKMLHDTAMAVIRKIG